MERKDSKIEVAAFWRNTSKNGKVYYTGKPSSDAGRASEVTGSGQPWKYIMFENEAATERQPQFRLYVDFAQPRASAEHVQREARDWRDRNGGSGGDDGIPF